MRFVVGPLSLAVMALTALAEDVPQFRGTNGSGVSRETGLPVTWSDKDGIRWKVELPGRGLSNPVIAGGKVFVTAATGHQQDRLHVLCYDLATGKKLWHRHIAATGTTLCHPKTNMAAPTPVTDGKHVYAMFATADLVAYDFAGNLVWYRSLVGDYPTVGNNVGMAASPTLWRDSVIVLMENAGESFAVAINTSTGENRWRIERPRIISWVTPLIIKNGQREEVLLQTAAELSAHDPATGKKLWSIDDKKFATTPSPIFGDGMIYTPGEKFFAIRPGSDKAKADIVWQSTKHPTGYTSPLYYQGRLYTLSAAGVLNYSDATTGNHLGALRLEGKYAASPLAADGKLYLVSEEGATTVVDATPQPKILSINQLPEVFLASPVAADGALFLRSDKHLYCIGKKK
jgi:outer membrane protein assembly factor BamB